MEHVMITIANNTNVSIDLCKASVNSEVLEPNSSREELTTDKSWIHGHSAVGSFVIQRDYAGFKIRSWGTLVVMQPKMIDNSILIEVLQKR
jgi:hypothetical protein